MKLGLDAREKIQILLKMRSLYCRKIRRQIEGQIQSMLEVMKDFKNIIIFTRILAPNWKFKKILIHWFGVACIKNTFYYGILLNTKWIFCQSSCATLEYNSRTVRFTITNDTIPTNFNLFCLHQIRNSLQSNTYICWPIWCIDWLIDFL